VRLTASERPTVEDLGGAHGVRVGGRKATVGQKVPVNRGDVVDIGGALLVVHPANEPTLARWDDHLVELLAQTTLSVVLMGEPGVGKTAAAEALIAASGGNAKLLDDVLVLPRDEKSRYVATTRRHDLWAGEGGIALLIPPLRDRPREIAALATKLLEDACSRAGRRRAPRISREALGALVRHSWLGNMRELRTTMEKALAASQGLEIEPKHLSFESVPLPPQTMQTLEPTASISSYPPPRK
jgi:transcriptional regulator with GAF, ATPase, and Fis domain